MAQPLFSLGAVDIYARRGGAKIADLTTQIRNFNLTQSSIVRIHGTPALVSHYERESNDLIVHMKNGTTMRYRRFFEQDEEGEHSRLIFEDHDGAIYHAVFPHTAPSMLPELVTPQFTDLADISSLLLVSYGTSSVGMGAILGGMALFSGAAIASATSHGNSSSSLTLYTPGANILFNAKTLQTPQLLAGSTTGVAPGAIVTLTLNGKIYTTTVNADGSWYYLFSTAELSTFNEGIYPLTVSVSDRHGATLRKTVNVLVDTIPPSLTVDNLTDGAHWDMGQINYDQTLSGTGEAGSRVSVTLNGITYTTTVGNNGSWSVRLPVSDLLQLQNGNYVLTVTATDPAGNQTTVDRGISVTGAGDEQTLQITILSVADDNIINAWKAQFPQVVAGQTDNAEAGQTTTVRMNGNTYTTLVQDDGSWAVTIPAAHLAALPQGIVRLRAFVSNASGETASTVDTILVSLNPPGLTANDLTDGDVLNAAAVQTAQTLSGTGDADQIVEVSLNGVTYSTAVDSNGNWSIELPAADLQALPQGENDLVITGTDMAGNITTLTQTLLVDTLAPTLTLDRFTGDDVVTADEQRSAQNITGTASVSEAGQTVSVTFNGNIYTGVVSANGTWSAAVSAADMAALANGSYDMVATLSDAVGNTTTTDPQVVTVDNTAVAVNIGIISSDNRLNALEAVVPLAINGTTANVATGAVVTVTLNGNNYTGQVLPDGTWTLQIPSADLQQLADGTNTLSASVPDGGGAVTSTQDLGVYIHTLPTVSLNTPFGDGILNSDEAGASQVLSGSTGITTSGQTVSVTLGGVTFSATVDSGGNWTVTIPAATLTALPDGALPIYVAAADAAGNSSTLQSGAIVDQTAPTLTVDVVAGDDILNAGEVQQNQTVSGTASQSEASQTVVLTLNDQTYSAVVQPDGTWSTDLPANDLQALANGSYDLMATLADNAGNTTSITHPISVAASVVAAPVIRLARFANNNVVTGAEANVAQNLSGTTDNVETAQTVTAQLNDNTYFASVQAGGDWNYVVPAADMALLPDGAVTLTAYVSDVAGNTADSSATILVDTAVESIAINVMAGDDRLSLTEALQPLNISGTTINVDAGQTVNVTLNGASYTGAVADDGSWSVSVDSADLLLLADGLAAVTASVTNANGGQVTGERDLTVMIHTLPSPTINAPFGDGYLNQAEAAVVQQLSGTTGITGAGQSVQVSVDGSVYPATVDANGNWSVTLAPNFMQSLADGSYTISVTAVDIAGNSISAGTTAQVVLTPPALSLRNFANNDWVNAQTNQSDQVVSGSASINDAGRAVTVTLNNKTYTTQVDSNGNWSATVAHSDLQAMADGSYPLSATLTDNAGNSTTVSHNIQVKANPSTLPTLSINAFAGNDILGGADIGVSQALTGSTTHVGSGQSVDIMLNNRLYSATVMGDGSWSTSVPAADLALLAQGAATFSATVSDSAGNPATATHTIVVDTALGSIAIDTLADDDRLNTAESVQPLIINGTSLNLAANAGVVVTFNGKTYPGAIQSEGTWSVSIPASDLAELADGDNRISVCALDRDDNPVSGSRMLEVYLQQLPDVTLNTPFNDGVLTASGAERAQILTGVTGVAAAGQSVTLTLGGVTYSGTVDSSGSWSVNLPAGDLQALPDGTLPIVVEVTDAAGNNDVLNGTIVVAKTPPTLTINAIAGDDVLNSAEVLLNQTVSGSATAGDAGLTVIVSLNGRSYGAQVQNDGSWSIVLPAADLTPLADGTYSLLATLTDNYGNSVNVAHGLSVRAGAANAPLLTINVFAGNNIIDGAEIQSAQTLSGGSRNVEAGQTVSISFNGRTYTAIVQADGTWSSVIPAADLALLTNGTLPVTANVTDSVGNPASVSRQLQVDLDSSALAISPISGDNQLNAQEAAAGIVISGNTINVATGNPVTVALNGRFYTASVQADGTWSAAIPAGFLAQLGDGSLNVTASATDEAGNVISASQRLAVMINNLPVATINTPFGNGYLNLAESGSDQTLSGTTGISGAGQTIRVVIGNDVYTGAVDNAGNWTVTLPRAYLAALSDGAIYITATVSDAAGNTSSASAGVTVDLTPPILTINTVSGDDIINIVESRQPLLITGTAPLNDNGQLVVVTVTVNGLAYNGLVQSDGNWSITVPAGDLAGLPNSLVTVDASLTDAAGNTGTVSRGITLAADPQAAPALTINTVSGDDYINQAESGQPLVISGASLRVETGQAVAVTLNNHTYNTQVTADGTWSLEVPAVDVGALPDGRNSIAATAGNIAGNTASAAHGVTVIADAADMPQLSVNVIAGDDIINYDEAQSDVVISGGSSHVQPGRVVGVSLNNNVYSGAAGSDGGWSITVPAADVQALPQGALTVNATVADIAGNAANAGHSVTVNTTPPLLDVHVFAGGNVLNLAQALVGQVLSGQTDAGLTVTASLQGNVYTALADGNGQWSINLPGNALQALPDGDVSIDVSVTDADGNTSAESLTVAVHIHTLPALTLDPLFGDGILNIAEVGEQTAIGGLALNLAAATQVTATIDNVVVSGSVNANGAWSATIAANALASLADGTVPVVISALDAAGNPASISASLEILSHTPPNPTIDVPFADGALNATEALLDHVLRGVTGIDGAGQTVRVTLNGQVYNAAVSLNGQWSVNITSADLQALADGTHTLSVTATDKGGNSQETSLTFNSVITGLPVAGLNTPFTDGILNYAQALQGGVLSGVTGLSGDVGQRVLVNLNGISLTAAVNADGSWTLPLASSVLLGLPDGSLPITVTVTDAVGNAGGVTGSVAVFINNLPAPTLNLPFENGLLNIADAAVAQTLSGTTGLTGGGQRVTVTVDAGTVNQQAFTAQADGLGGWSLTLDVQQLGVFTNGAHTLRVSVEDGGGNAAATPPQDVTAMLTLPQPVLDPPFGVQERVNIALAAGAITLTGSTGVTGSGQSVRVTLTANGTNYSATVDANGAWTLPLPAGVLSTLADGAHILTVTARDIAGNVNSTSLNYSSFLTAPVPSIALPFGDGYLNLAKASLGQTLSGNAGDATAVSIVIGSQTFTAQVNGGAWVLPLSTAQLSGLSEGSNIISVTATDAAGNQGSAQSSLYVAITTQPSIVINDVGANNLLNYVQSQTVLQITGTTSNVAIGQQVAVTLNGVTYSGTVLANGSWSITVLPSALQALSGTPLISAEVADRAGNTAVASHSFTVNLTPPTYGISVDPVLGDNIVNATEIGQAINLTGKVLGGSGAGQAITVTVDGEALTSPVTTAADGTFACQITFPVDGNIVVTASATLSTPQATVYTASETVLVDRTPPTLAVNTFAIDDVLNADESTVAQAISGSATVSQAGRVVTVTLNGKTYGAQVGVTGTWSVNVPPADLVNLPQGGNTIVVTLQDTAGNSALVTHSITVDTSAPLLSVNLLNQGNVLTLAQALVDQTLTGSGGVGENVTVTLGPLTTSAVVGADGTWRVTLPALTLQNLTDGPQIIGVTAQDIAGNTTHADIALNVALNRTLSAGVNALFGGDGVLNLAESLVSQTISGNATGDYHGAVVHVTVAGVTLDTTVGGNGLWSVTLTPGQLNLLNDGQAQVAVQIVDAHGNVVNNPVNISVLIHNLPVIGAVNAFNNGLLNAAQAVTAQTVSGVISNLSAGGGNITVTLGAKLYTTAVSGNGAWSLSIPPADLAALSDGAGTLGVTVTDWAGNVVSQSVNFTAIIHNLPQLVLNPIFGDGVLNVADLAINQVISGSAGNLARGAAITLNIAGVRTLTATVGDGGQWSATLTPDILALLQGLGNGNVTVTASASDSVGNTASAGAGLQIAVAPPQITLDPLFGGDGYLNAAEALSAQVVSGAVANAQAGSRVQLSFGGKNYITTLGVDGRFSLTLQPADLRLLADGNAAIGMTVYDSTGNTGTVNTSVNVVINQLPTITLNPLFSGSGYLNASQALSTQTISGVTTHAAAGSRVVVNVGAVQLNATVGADGTWSAPITSAQMAGLAAGNITVSATVTDPAGNTGSASVGLNVATVVPTLTLNPLFGDGVLDLTDLLTAQTLSGSAGNAAAGTVVTLTLGGHSYTAAVNGSGTWQIPIPTADLQGLADGILNLTATLTDVAGNVATQTRPFTVQINAQPVVTLNPLFGGDGLLNAVEAATSQTVSGSVTNAPGATVRITLGANTYTTLVRSDGTWSYSLTPQNLAGLADGSLSLGVSVTNSAGKVSTASASVGIGIHNLPTVSLNALFGDGYLNLSESAVNQLISGVSTNAVGAGVSVNVAGLTLAATVGSDGRWSVSVPTATLSRTLDGTLPVSVTVTDRYGNTNSASANATVKIHALPLLGIDAVANLTNAVTILANGLTVSGSSLNVQQGAQVSVTLRGSTLIGTVDATGHWTVKFDSTNGLKGLTSLNLLSTLQSSFVAASVSDVAGNSVSVSAGLTTGVVLPVSLAASSFISMMAMDVLWDESLTEDNGDLFAPTGQMRAAAPITAGQDSAANAGQDTLVQSGAASLTTQAPAAHDEASDIQALPTLNETSDIQTLPALNETSDIQALPALNETSDIQALPALSETSDIQALPAFEETSNICAQPALEDERFFPAPDNVFRIGDATVVTDHRPNNQVAGPGDNVVELDASALGLNVQHIDIHVTGTHGNKSIALDLNETLTVNDVEGDFLQIRGDETNQINLPPAQGGVWSSAGQKVIGDQLYDVYHHSLMGSGHTLGDVLVQHGLHVNLM